MSNSRVANRYAEALMIAAEEAKILNDVGNNLTAIKELINSSNEFKLFLKSPVIKKDKKKEVFKSLFSNKIAPITLQFLLLITEKQREDLLLDIIDCFFKLQDEKLGYISLHVKSAVGLTEQQINEFKNQFEEYSKKKVRIEAEVEKELIGGFVARIGDTMYDASVKRQLQLLKQRLAEEVEV